MRFTAQDLGQRPETPLHGVSHQDSGALRQFEDQPIVFSPNDFMVAVSGDPLRTNAINFAHNGILGYTVAREIELPKDWDAKLRASR